MFRISFYVPVDALEAVKRAMFDKGAGRIGDYDCCAWQVQGSGQFRPLAGSKPALGAQGKVEAVEEFMVEMVCTDDVLAAVIAALCEAHPYEKPAYQYWRVNAEAP
ncbi:MAG: NGG1p interacting factor NIF3 [Pseudomonadales bacterium]